ncbi:HAD family hydrolase [Salinivibrio kushneri]|uniref:HAD family hydrolase n=1 Tax=Salinivibrio kushneri TaxID=1908198 RepID=UPI0022B3F49E|nr:HAD hydrolase-like protein [Salinivibrio kushneri]WBA17126.1 HAD hydrolase-like protein [Salinivibrio kushneri]
MPFNPTYDVYIFDCDGVILDSNQLKINAMASALRALDFSEEQVQQCSDYLSQNFGKSRFHHVSYFIEHILDLNESTDNKTLEQQILERFSSQCQQLYLKADITPGYLDFLQSLKGRKYIASGSAQEELRGVFKARQLDHYFNGIYGSPTAKTDNIKHILTLEDTKKAIMFGDALSDLDSSLDNQIDFIAYRPYSNVPDKLTNQSQNNGFIVIDQWAELI